MSQNLVLYHYYLRMSLVSRSRIRDGICGREEHVRLQQTWLHGVRQREEPGSAHAEGAWCCSSQGNASSRYYHRRSGSRSHKRAGFGPVWPVDGNSPKQRTGPSPARAPEGKHHDPRTTVTWQCQTRAGSLPWQFRPLRSNTHSESGFCPGALCVIYVYKRHGIPSSYGRSR